MMADLNKELRIPNKEAKALLKDVKARCPHCESRGKAPKDMPHTPIFSAAFGERLVIDLKKIGTRGYLLVVIDHHTSYSWAKHLETKEADGVADFLQVVFDEVETIRKSWREARAEASEREPGSTPSSRPANDDDDVLNAPLIAQEFIRMIDKTDYQDNIDNVSCEAIELIIDHLEHASIVFEH